MYAVYNTDANYAALLCRGAYHVDWGDGNSEDVADNTQVNHNLVYANLNSNTLCSRGYRQAIITITPQAGQNLTVIDLTVKNTNLGSSTPSNAIIDIKAAGQSITNFYVSKVSPGVWNYELEQVEFIGSNAITDFTYFFYLCRNLKKIISFYTGAGTTFASMFQSCYSLQTIPLLNTSARNKFLEHVQWLLFSTIYSVIEHL